VLPFMTHIHVYAHQKATALAMAYGFWRTESELWPQPVQAWLFWAQPQPAYAFELSCVY
jgi:hypothetical protein